MPGINQYLNIMLLLVDSISINDILLHLRDHQILWMSPHPLEIGYRIFMFEGLLLHKFLAIEAPYFDPPSEGTGQSVSIPLPVD